jgi:hypothetical protein
MAITILNHSIAGSAELVTKIPLMKRFLDWCASQQEKKFLWLGIALTAHGCIITPITIMAVTLAGTSLVLFILAIAAMGLVLVTNLAALPTKITIPSLFFSIAVDLGIIIACALNGFNLSNVFS